MTDPAAGTEQANVLDETYSAKPDELVVSLSYLALVCQKFDDLDLPQPAVKRRSDSLNLALLQLDQPEAIARRVHDAVEDLPARAPGTRSDPGGTAQPLDKILWGLRALFGADNGGWAPPLGKNRFLGSVHGVGEVQHVAVGAPVPRRVSLAPATRADQPGSRVRVGVLDGGFYPHEWLAGGYSAAAWDLLPDKPVPGLMEGHATFVTGLILSQAPGARVDVRQVLDSRGMAESWDVAEALLDLGQSGVDVLNLSFACFTVDGEVPLVLAAAIDRLDPEIAVIAAAGNHGEAESAGRQNFGPAWPAALDSVIAVGAAGAPDQGSVRRASFSPDAPWVDLYAPGVDVRSTYLPRAATDQAVEDFKTWAEWSGTSFAAALVSGAIAAATDPGRISAAAAARALVTRLNHGPALTVEDTSGKKYVGLRLL